MYEELRNKKVKMIVGTNSGVSVGAGAAVAASFLTIYGTFSNYDGDMVKLTNAQMTGAIPGEISLSFGGGTYHSSSEECEVLYINKWSIIAISVLGE